MGKKARRYFRATVPEQEDAGTADSDEKQLEPGVKFLFQLAGGDLAAVPIALEMPVTEAYDWLFLKRQKAETEMNWQAALHGVKLKSPTGSAAHAPQINARHFMQMLGGNVERVMVSKEELARRQKMLNEGK